MFLTQLGRSLKLRTQLNDETFVEISSRIAGVADCKRLFRELFLSRAEQELELKRLRKSYLSGSWKETNLKFDDFVLNLFQDALDGKHPDSEWPECHRFKDGIQRIFSEHLPRLKKWLSKHKPPPAPVASPAAFPIAPPAAAPAEMDGGN